MPLIKENHEIKTNSFDDLLTEEYKKLSSIHWTPSAVIKTSVDWLVQHNAQKVLDLGSGVGKFCLLGAQHADLLFVGVETRKKLVDVAKALKKQLNLDHTRFLHADILSIDFTQYDSFYYYNPFCEQICNDEWIDTDLEFSDENFEKYQNYVVDQFHLAPIGTKIITYRSYELELPFDYHLNDMAFDGKLQLWIKK